MCRGCVNRQTVYEELAKRQQKCIGLVGVNSDAGMFVNRLESSVSLRSSREGRGGGDGRQQTNKNIVLPNVCTNPTSVMD